MVRCQQTTLAAVGGSAMLDELRLRPQSGSRLGMEDQGLNLIRRDLQAADNRYGADPRYSTAPGVYPYRPAPIVYPAVVTATASGSPAVAVGTPAVAVGTPAQLLHTADGGQVRFRSWVDPQTGEIQHEAVRSDASGREVQRVEWTGGG